MIQSKLSSAEVKRLMRKHKVTIRALASEMQITQKRIREVRDKGVTGPAVRDWVEHITGHDPGPQPTRYRINHHTFEATCGWCGCPLYVGDWAFEYVGGVYCSKTCCRKDRNYEAAARNRERTEPMKADFRVVYHDPQGKARVLRPASQAEDTADAMAFKLEHYVESGYAIGGHIESFVRGIGWVVFD